MSTMLTSRATPKGFFVRARTTRRSVLVLFVTLAMVAAACAESSSSRSAAVTGGNPVDLPALPSGSATGERTPVWFGAEVTPSSWVSTSLSPTLLVPGASGAWTFTLSDLSDGTSAFGSRTYSETGNSTRIPVGLLQNGDTYTWRAESSGQSPVGGSFTVDVQMLDTQQIDSAGGIDVLLSSGEAAYSWFSHTMQSLGGPVGVSLRFQTSNAPSPGVPSGWRLTTSSGSPFSSVVARPDGSIGLVSKNGQVSSYRQGAGASWEPVKMAGDGLDTSGLAPVLIRNGDGSWSVTTKSSTARFVDDNGDGVADLSSISADGAPMLQQEWSGGLLRKITDPVSKRSVELFYGGDSCPKNAAGFVAAPAGMLCEVKFWDGSSSAFSYVSLPDGSVSIGRLADYPEAGASGAQISDVAYDGAGRITRTRSPLVASAAASSIVGIDDSQFWAEVNYLPEGRVASITDAAAAVGGERCIRSYDNQGTGSSVSDSCIGKLITIVQFDGTTFFPLQLTDITGRTSTNTWNLSTGDLLSSVDETGRVTTNTYANGNLVRSVGPSRDVSTAQIGLRDYDKTYANGPDGEAMRGLDVVYWPSTTERGANAVQELGPLRDGSLLPSLTINWDTSPAGNGDGGWSGLMNGSLSITTPGAYSFTSGNSTARLRVANLACEGGGCSNIELPAGRVSLRVEIEAPTPQASIDLSWSGPDTGGVSQSIPTDRLHPQYGLVTETKVVDPTAVRSNADSVSRSIYADPAKGLVTGRINGGGSVSTLTYDGKGWNRPTGSVLPGGNRMQQIWWGDTESATAPCSGAKAAVQGGAMKQTITPGSDGGNGPSAQQWFTASGALAGSQLSGGATSCLTYDKAGRVVKAETKGLGETAVIEVSYALNGNPLISTATETRGDFVATSTVEIDLAGRVVRSVDRNGIVTLTTYDRRTGEVATNVSTPPNGAPIATSYGYDEFGRPTTTTIDGRTVATIGYGEFGLPTKVTYGNGAVTELAIDDQNRVVAASINAGGRVWSSSRVLTSAGITSSATTSAEGKISTFEYTHDSNGRLTAVSLSAGLVPEARAWTYAYDANSNRTAQSVSVAGTTSQFNYTYDKADRLISTTDPAASNIVYDERGNATTVGPDTFTFDSSNLLTSATDGSTTVTYERSADGTVVAKTTTDAKGTTTFRFGADGMILDEQGRLTARVVALPAGAQLTTRFEAAPRSEWMFTAINGDRLVTLDDGGAPIGTVSVFTPFGEQVLGTATIDGSVPDFTWKATEGNEMIALRTPIVAMGQRVYVPALGRFIQVDPVAGGSANGYDYANQDPTSFTDPTGNTDPSALDWLGVALVAVASIGAGLLIPANAGPAISMVMGAAIGAIISGVNAMVQVSNGGDGTTALIGVAVGILGGLAGGGIGYKVKMARAVQSGSSRSPGFGEYSSMDEFLASEGQVRYASDSGAGRGAKVPKVSAKTSVKPSQVKPQVSSGGKPPQVQIKIQNVEKPAEIKVPTHTASPRKMSTSSDLTSKSSEREYRNSFGMTRKMLALLSD